MNESTKAFVAAYTPRYGIGWNAAFEATLTIRPRRLLEHRRQEHARQLDHCADVQVAHRPDHRQRLRRERAREPEPGAVDEAVHCEAALVELRLQQLRGAFARRSTVTSDRGGLAPSSADSASSRSCRRATRTTDSPRARRARAYSAPIPLDAPVTSVRQVVSAKTRDSPGLNYYLKCGELSPARGACAARPRGPR